MWLPSSVISEVDEVATISYVSSADTALWNEHRREGELRLLTGWAWTSKNGRDHRQGFKTQTVAYRDAWYALCAHRRAVWQPHKRLRVVGGRS